MSTLKRSYALKTIVFSVLIVGVVGFSTAGEEQPSCHAEPTKTAGADAAGEQHSTATDSLPTRQLSEPVNLYNQDGDAIVFPKDVLGEKLVAVNFVFTRCSTICPPMGAAFGRLQKKLAKRPDLDVDLISVSIDPVHDTPQRLTTWAERFGRQDGWTLLTGSKPDVDRVLRSLDAFTPDKFEHAALLLIGNPKTGNWTRIDGLAGPKETMAALERLKTDSSVTSMAR